jgi:tRNA (guanine37-N1)-methyltransferase
MLVIFPLPLNTNPIALYMRIDIITLFPGMFQGPLTESIIGRARDANLLEIHAHDIRDWGLGNYKQTDDEPYGGGAGMVMRVDVIVPAIEAVMAMDERKAHRVYLSARGETLRQEKVETLASSTERLILLCGHYEGIDQRIVEGGWIDEEISIGNYVLTGGELPAMVLIDSVARHIPGVLGKEISAHEESHSAELDRKKEYPHYTRPDVFRDIKVPDVLLSGHHAEIEKWRRSNLS